MRERLFIVLLCSAFIINTKAQIVDQDLVLLNIINQQSLDLHTRDTLIVGDSIMVLCDTIWKHYLTPLYIPLMYVPQTFPALRDTLYDAKSMFAIRQNVRRYITANHADMYVSVSDPNRLKDLELKKKKVQRMEVRSVQEDDFDASRSLHDTRSPWRKEANLSLQITQNYATENWQQGGVNAFSMLWNAKGFINYKKENISWQNNAEWRVGLSTVSGDTIRKMNTTDDIFQLYSKLGYQFHKKWYITVLADFRTTFFPNFKKNDNRLNSTFLTPLRFSMGVGIDYKPIKGLSINISPATYKLVYASVSDSTRIDVTEYGITKGKNALNEIGSSVRVEWKWKPIREIELETKFYFFTNYKQIETELEIDVDFIINRYLSARLMLHPRYDGTIENVTDQKSKLQFKELISVGFAHTFR